jgi:hypothetical protein
MSRYAEPVPYGLYQTDPNLIEMVADSKDLAATYRTMFGGPRWKVRKLTAAEATHPFVVKELRELADRRSNLNER